MLTELHIEDLGVIERLDLVLGTGLTALTGETGAGKTMLVEAINLLVGGRADGSRVRTGAVEARVEGRFVVGNDETVLARVVPVDGRSRAYVNGRLATVSTLAEIGAALVDLHGQHAHQSLLGAVTQRAALDRFAGVDLAPLRAARARLTELDAMLATLGGDVRARAREIDLLRFQVEEIDAVGVGDTDEEAVLDRLEETLADAVAHREAAATALVSLVDDGGALDDLGAAVAALGPRAPFVDEASRLRSLLEELTDLSRDLRARGESVEDDPAKLADVRARRQALREMCRKYGDTLADVVAFRHEAASRLAELESFEQRAAMLEHERAAAVAQERAAAAVVGAARRARAPQLAAEVEKHLAVLAMPHAQVSISVGSDDPGDDVVFLLAANPGSPPLPLARTASGGELARAMLALRLVLSEAPGTLVFDEVDAGIGGQAATAVAQALAKLGERHQILVVTHLAQVAAAATSQWVVTKHVDESNASTSTTVAYVTGDDRLDELARMLSGRADRTSARQHAAELLADLGTRGATSSRKRST
jgi:DNA repair protein RecN (Recombination protein N)